MARKIQKVLKLADRAGVETILLSGKGEPMLNENGVINILRWFKDFPCELQTNGKQLNKQFYIISRLAQEGLDTIAISVDTLSEIRQYYDLIQEIKACGILVRVCLNISMLTIKKEFNFPYNEVVIWEQIMDTIRMVDAHQLLIRNITVPKNTVDSDEARATKGWIEGNSLPALYNGLCEYVMGKPKEMLVTPSPYHITNFFPPADNRIVRVTAHGIPIYDVDGVSVLFSDYCIEEKSNDNDTRSLVFHEDGHVYTLWNSPASILF